MIPLHDDNPTVLRPIVTVGIIAACVVFFLWELSLSPAEAERAIYGFGLVPAVLFGERALPAGVAVIPPELSVITSMFLHGGWMHLGGNMLYLWIFGNNIEDAMGHVRFVVFYLLCGAAAALAQGIQDPGSTVPMIGASGAIGGILGGYLLLFPRARVLVLIPLGFFMQVVRVPAVIVLGLWFVIQFLFSAMAGGAPGGVAYWAHVGGFVAGVVLIIPFRNKAFPLFAGPRRSDPTAGPRTRRAGPWAKSGRSRGSRRQGPWS